MKPAQKEAVRPENGLLPRVFAGVFGAFLGISLLKFGNPAVFEQLIERPANLYEWVLNPWPVVMGYGLLGVVLIAGLLSASLRTSAPRWLILLPLVWLAWQCAAGTRTVDDGLTRPVLLHFAAGAVCFYLGCFALSRVENLRLFWGGLLGGFLLVLAVGVRQELGGLEETRKFFFLYIYPELKEVTPEYLKKLTSDRIFSTLFYPNTLAGALLLLGPALLGFVSANTGKLARPARWLLPAAAGTVVLACLYWSGSKGGWLLMLLIGLVWLLHLRFHRWLKIALAGLVLAAGLAGFFWRNSAFFERGAPSVGARFDYWQAAWQTAKEHPVLGTGPGTFAVAYKQIKRPESEMARLAHNDYLQQACDSGFPGFLAYVGFISTSLWWAYFKRGIGSGWLTFSVWLGLLGWGLQGLLEFGLYIPALAWPAMGLLGWLVGLPRNRIDKAPAIP